MISSTVLRQLNLITLTGLWGGAGGGSRGEGGEGRGREQGMGEGAGDGGREEEGGQDIIVTTYLKKSLPPHPPFR